MDDDFLKQEIHILIRFHACRVTDVTFMLKDIITSSAQLRSAQIRSALVVVMVWLWVGLSLVGVGFSLGND